MAAFTRVLFVKPRERGNMESETRPADPKCN